MFSKLVDNVFDFGGRKCNTRSCKVIKITPHHMAGVMSGIDCAKMHYNSDKAISANYYIGNDGDICGGVAEEKRAWTSSSRDNDHHAITIEVSNDKTGGKWTISDKAYKSLIRLCADICERYNIMPKYNGNDTGTITVHNMFASTECPGEYLQNIIDTGVFESDIIKMMGIEPDEPIVHTGEEYTIEEGDTLTSIAKKFGTTVTFLKSINDIPDANKIYAGDTIHVSIVYEIEKGDTLTSIAKKFKTTVKRLTDLNNIENPDMIKAGDFIEIR